MEQEVKNKQDENENIRAMYGSIRSDAENKNSQTNLNQEIMEKVRQEAKVASNTAAKIKQNMYLDGLSIPRAENQAAVERTSAARAASYIDRAKETLGGMSFPSKKGGSGRFGRYDKHTGELFD